MSLEPNYKVGKDTSSTPLESDFTVYFSNMFKNYHKHPLVARRIAPFTAPAAFDGKLDHVTPLLGEAERPGYAMFPGKRNNRVEAEIVTVSMPQIFDGAEMANDVWARVIGGQAKEPVTLGGIMEKMKQEEDIITFQGRASESISGLLSTATHDMGAPSGKWDVDANADGKLEVALADIRAAKVYLQNLVPGYPIDAVMTEPLYDLLKDTVLVNAPQITNIDLAKRILQYQEDDPMPVILKSDWIQSPGTAVTADANSILYIPRIPFEAGPAWHLISSGFGMEKKDGEAPFSTQINIREKFVPKILKGTLIAWMNAIDTVT